MNPCSECGMSAGDDALLLKNGTTLCPECFQKNYGAKKEPSPKRTGVSIEAAIAICVIIGILALCYGIYSKNVESNRLANIAEKKRAEKELKREEEERKAAELARRKYEEEHKLILAQQERDRRERLQREKVLAENALKAKASADAERRAREEAALKTVTIDPKVQAARLAMQAEEAALAAAHDAARTLTAKERLSEIKTLSAAVIRLTKLIKDLEETKSALLIKLPAWKTLSANIEKRRMDMAAGDTFDPKQDQILAELIKSQQTVAKLSYELSGVEAKLANFKSQHDGATARIAELNPNAFDLELINAAPAPATVPGSRILLLKNGTTLYVKSLITMDAEIHYKDEAGKLHMIKKDDVEKIQ